MRVAYCGNFGSAVGLGAEVAAGAAHATTESHWAGSLERLGHEVMRVDEERTPWAERVRIAESCDMFLWTSTWAFNAAWTPLADGFRSVRYLHERGVPTACVHLDRWHGLANRERQVTDRRTGSAMFACDFVFTADGDSDDWFRSHDVNHFWLPPGVYEPECVPGTPRDEWRSDVAFIGGWQDYGHSEHWEHRKAMLDALRAAFGDRAAFWPKVGEPGPWGSDYNDLLASVKVVVGDAWRDARRYFSNRAVEVIGRGGFCVHPWIEGLAERIPEGCGVAYFPPGDWDAMCDLVEHYSTHDDERLEAVAKGQAHVLSSETYTHRMAEMLSTMQAAGAWR